MEKFNMTRNLLAALLLSGLLSCGGTEKGTHPSDINETEKQNIGNVPALYPKPMTVIGAEVDGKVNWLVVGHRPDTCQHEQKPLYQSRNTGIEKTVH